MMRRVFGSSALIFSQLLTPIPHPPNKLVGVMLGSCTARSEGCAVVSLCKVCMYYWCVGDPTLNKVCLHSALLIVSARAWQMPINGLPPQSVMGLCNPGSSTLPCTLLPYDDILITYKHVISIRWEDTVAALPHTSVGGCTGR